MNRLRTEFLTGCAGPVYLASFLPSSEIRASIVVVQPFAEEANKSRRMIALMAHTLAEVGVAVYVPDFYGCGDSSGDFADADWSVWQRDLIMTVNLAAERHARRVVPLGLRLGAMLISEVLYDLPAVDRIVFWHPVIRGDQALAQFLRLRTAASMMENVKESASDLNRRLETGEPLEIAGYTLSPMLAASLSTAKLRVPPERGLASAHWFWVSNADSVPPLLWKARADWAAAGWATEVETVHGDAFWATQEIATVPVLIDRTAAAVSGMLP